ncbi:hypothetical protein BH10CYA1_BH10CYA1_21450 [soil metagenome]
MNRLRSQTFNADVHGLPKDLKRVLKVQFREFIHLIEDAQDKIYYPANNFGRGDIQLAQRQFDNYQNCKMKGAGFKTAPSI